MRGNRIAERDQKHLFFRAARPALLCSFFEGLGCAEQKDGPFVLTAFVHAHRFVFGQGTETATTVFVSGGHDMLGGTFAVIGFFATVLGVSTPFCA